MIPKSMKMSLYRQTLASERIYPLLGALAHVLSPDPDKEKGEFI